MSKHTYSQIQSETYKNWINHVLDEADVPSNIRVQNIVEDLSNAKMVGFIVQSLAVQPITLVSDPNWTPKFSIQNSELIDKVFFFFNYYYFNVCLIFKTCLFSMFLKKKKSGNSTFG